MFAIVFLVLVLFILILAPILAEAALNDSEFSVNRMDIVGENIKDCAASAAFCLDTILVSTLYNPLIFGVTVEPFTASFSTDEADLGYSSMPAVKVKASSHTVVNETVVVTVSNRSEFDRFSADIISKISHYEGKADM
ncbi:hypothetical protein Pmar_PMAR011341 [Perkinsus marinus ATCC 50983]|uniref:Uncharacterized protein n=1 Tax=Perkinsus marinus (strain ATCC 50983 / TXsc) TaxID=423536 RepID=C5KFA8_PERM5|nr:hypothetical protein Pmar_PMAR011341 [Perkinsus marinus ATCC 50983]EER16827.1 hypothetical protein Pmar_PMAR011341 [Perkinsus marinus ATCC 50983]|eukprot:XP_002785031.1 hypothetical protein Pmar_PMAR011341 [Perkinsus marinus ATCC 50983]